MNHKGMCPYAVDSSTFTMAAIVVDSSGDDEIDVYGDDADIDMIAANANDGANGEPKVVAAPPRRDRKRKLAVVSDGIASSSDGIASSSTATAHDGIASSSTATALVCVPCQTRFRTPAKLAMHKQRVHK